MTKSYAQLKAEGGDRNACTCDQWRRRDQYGEVHRVGCARWVAEWKRRASVKDLTH